jgi:hypothetical protein
MGIGWITREDDCGKGSALPTHLSVRNQLERDSPYQERTNPHCIATRFGQYTREELRNQHCGLRRFWNRCGDRLDWFTWNGNFVRFCVTEAILHDNSFSCRHRLSLVESCPPGFLRAWPRNAAVRSALFGPIQRFRELGDVLPLGMVSVWRSWVAVRR